MMGGFVAVGILADKAGDVGRYDVPFEFGGSCEKGIQAGGELFFTTVKLDEAGDVVEDKPAPLPCGSFAVIVVAVVG